MPLTAEYHEALKASLAEANLVSSVLTTTIPGDGDDFRPTTRLHVMYGDGKAVDNGTFFRAGECAEAPRIKFAPEEKDEEDEYNDASYTLLLVDPDAPTPDEPKYAFWRHWVLSGLRPQGPGDSADATAAASELTTYLGPGPKDDSKPHRYVFLLYREPRGGLSLSKEDVGGEEFTQRRSFKPAEFAERHSLRLVGVNWMYCAGDGWKE
ncbi:phosphatidylethanolamine-binding protein [Xylariaceae sp. FL0594]|nr:phosphatidylethanolamine-binding protein [Xylariaceae sp. FL0594]